MTRMISHREREKDQEKEVFRVVKISFEIFTSSKNASKTLHSGTDNEQEAGNHGNKKASRSNAFHCSLARPLVFFLAERLLDTGKYFEGDQDNLFPTKEKIVR